jgi:hypothetical protein
MLAHRKYVVFCCDSAVPVRIGAPEKLHKDPNRELHQAIFQSFVTFAVRRQSKADIEAQNRAMVQKKLKTKSKKAIKSSSSRAVPLYKPRVEAPLYNANELRNNPLTAQTAYVIHLTSRYDFGPVYSHRYFICPTDLRDDWTEVTHTQWFGEGKRFDLKAEQWDLKCPRDRRFFRLTLRPNLEMRSCFPIKVPIYGSMSDRHLSSDIVHEIGSSPAFSQINARPVSVIGDGFQSFGCAEACGFVPESGRYLDERQRTTRCLGCLF